MPVHNGPAFWIKISAQQDGSFTVTNARNNFNKTYKAGSYKSFGQSTELYRGLHANQIPVPEEQGEVHQNTSATSALIKMEIDEDLELNRHCLAIHSSRITFPFTSMLSWLRHPIHSPRYVRPC